MVGHYILTEFNTDSPYDLTQPHYKSWIIKRLKIWENYCFPSVKRQKDQNFTWVVGFKDGTNLKPFRKYTTYKNLHILMVPENWTFLQTVDKYLIGKPLEVSLWTLLPSTCGLNINFTKFIQSDKSKKMNSFVHYSGGYFLDFHHAQIIPELTQQPPIKTLYGYADQLFTDDSDASKHSSSYLDPMWVRVFYDQDSQTPIKQKAQFLDSNIDKFSYLSLKYKKQLISKRDNHVLKNSQNRFISPEQRQRNIEQTQRNIHRRRFGRQDLSKLKTVTIQRGGRQLKPSKPRTRTKTKPGKITKVICKNNKCKLINVSDKKKNKPTNKKNDKKTQANGQKPQTNDQKPQTNDSIIQLLYENKIQAINDDNKYFIIKVDGDQLKNL